MQGISPIFYIIVLIMSVVIHEVAHGYAALKYGDTTAKYAGRLTLNPLKHLDLYGSVIIPLLLVITNAPFLIGWAKPVPYNPNNFRPEDRRAGTFWVASAGILANLSLAVFFGLVIRSAGAFSFIPVSIIPLASVIVLINIILALFNLIPIVPLDGSKILFTILGYRARKVEIFLQSFSFLLIIIFILFLWQYLRAPIYWLFNLFTGL